MVIINLTNNINIDNFVDIVNQIKKYLNNAQAKQLEIENSINSKKIKSEYVIDRFEGEFAVCENINDNKMLNIKKELLPINAKEGNVIRYNGNRYIIDFKKSNLLKENIKAITNDLWEN